MVLCFLLQQEDLNEEQLVEKGAEEGVEGGAENRSGGGTENRDERTGDGKTEEVQEDPLHKYMLMVMQGREREQVHTHTHSADADQCVCDRVISSFFQGMKKDESENQSPEAVVLSDHKDDR